MYPICLFHHNWFNNYLIFKACKGHPGPVYFPVTWTSRTKSRARRRRLALAINWEGPKNWILIQQKWQVIAFLAGNFLWLNAFFICRCMDIYILNKGFQSKDGRVRRKSIGFGFTNSWILTYTTWEICNFDLQVSWPLRLVVSKTVCSSRFLRVFEFSSVSDMDMVSHQLTVKLLLGRLGRLGWWSMSFKSKTCTNCHETKT